MIKLRDRSRKSPEIMLSPMIDMMFLLLIFFIVSTMYMSELRTIPVKLPVATQTQTQTANRFTVTIKADGAYWLGDQLIDKYDLMDVPAIYLLDENKVTLAKDINPDVLSALLEYYLAPEQE